MIKFVKEIYPRTTKIHYFSDGAAAHYKNYKNFANLIQHKEDFGIAAEWHFLQHRMVKVPVMESVELLKEQLHKLVFKPLLGDFY